MAKKLVNLNKYLQQSHWKTLSKMMFPNNVETNTFLVSC